MQDRGHMYRLSWCGYRDMAFIEIEALRGTKHRKKRQRLQRFDDAIHRTINGLGVIGRLREKRSCGRHHNLEG